MLAKINRLENAARMAMAHPPAYTDARRSRASGRLGPLALGGGLAAVAIAAGILFL